MCAIFSFFWIGGVVVAGGGGVGVGGGGGGGSREGQIDCLKITTDDDDVGLGTLFKGYDYGLVYQDR